MNPSEKKKSKPKKSQSSLNNYARYSGLAFQMIAIMLAGVFGGIKLDQYVNLEFPLFTFVLTILAVILAIYYSIKDLIKFK